MTKPKRKNFNTTLKPDLVKGLKMLAVEKGVCANALLEEAIKDLLKKHKDNHLTTSERL